MAVTEIRTVCFLTLLYLVLTQSSALGQKQLAPLPIKEAIKTLNLPMFIPIDLSPDGKLVAYTLQGIGRKEETAGSVSPTGVPRSALYCDVWISDLKTGAATNLTQGKGTSWGPVWSPDGKYLAFYSDRGGVQSLWVWERASGTLRQVSDAIVRVRIETMVPRWTPDSKKLVIKALPEGMTLAHVPTLLSAHEPKRGAQNEPDKEPGSTVVLYSAKASSTKVELEQERIRQNSYLAASAVDLAVVDVATGETKRLARRIIADNWWVSPDGTNLAVLVPKGRESQQTLQALWDLSVISLVSGETRTLVSNFGSDVLIPLSWSPNGKMLAYLTMGPTVKNDCWVVPVGGGEPRNLTPGEHPIFDGSYIYRGPLWDANGDNIYLLSKSSLWRATFVNGQASAIATIPERTLRDIISPDGRTLWSPNDDNCLVVITRDEETKQEGFYKIDLRTGKYDKILEENKSYAFVPLVKTAVSADSRHIVYAAQSAAEAEEIWTIDADLSRPKRVTHINPIFDRYVMGKGRMIEWGTVNGQKARAALLLPAGYQPGKRYPLIVYQYPGSMWSNNGNLFGFNPFASPAENWQLLATRGYAVLMPDVLARRETYMQDIAKAVLPAVEKVIELGIADPDRLGITGQSDGGYGVLSLIVQSNRFKAAVDRMGPANLISIYTQMTDEGVSAFMGEMVKRTGGSLWEKRDKFIDNSPIFYFDRVQTPVLIIQGTADRQVMAARSDEVFVSLRFLGKDVEYAKYVGESHGVAEWSYPNQVDYLNRMIGWFDRWLKR
jgi:dipeptidyl aminopeptidase/acylaminoacyl peptidase